MGGNEDDRPLPLYWRKKESRSRPGEIYYINVKTRTTTWQHPGYADEKLQKSSTKDGVKLKDTFTGGKWTKSEVSRQKKPDEVLRASSEVSAPTRLVLHAKRRSLTQPAGCFTKDVTSQDTIGQSLTHPAGRFAKATNSQIEEQSKSAKRKMGIPKTMPPCEIQKKQKLTPPPDIAVPKKTIEWKKKAPKSTGQLLPRPVTVSNAGSAKSAKRNSRDPQGNDCKVKQMPNTQPKSPDPVRKHTPYSTKRIFTPASKYSSSSASSLFQLPLSPPITPSPTTSSTSSTPPTPSSSSATPSPLTTPPQTPRGPHSLQGSSEREVSHGPRSLKRSLKRGASHGPTSLQNSSERDESHGPRSVKRSLEEDTSHGPKSVKRSLEEDTSHGPKSLKRPSGEDLSYGPRSVERSPEGDASCGVGAASHSSETEMEVDVDEGLLQDLMTVRRHTAVPTQEADSFTKVFSQRFTETTDEPKMYIIVDTNVLMHDLQFVDSIKDRAFPHRPTLIIPWVVLQELDSLKNGKTGTAAALRTQLLARNPVNYLNQALQEKHPRIVGQTPDQDRSDDGRGELRVECNDDRVLRCCIQWIKRYPSAEVLLLTLDKNLQNKAVVAGLQCADITELKFHLEEGDGTDNNERKKETNPKLEAEKKLADEIMCELKDLLRVALSVVLTTEMRGVYDDLWLEIVYKKPPWTLFDALECFNKHWIAVFGTILHRNKKRFLDKLRTHFKPGARYGMSLLHLKEMVTDSGNFLQAIRHHSTYDGKLDAADKKLRVLYKVSRDVSNGTKDAMPLNDMAALYSTDAKIFTESTLSEESRNIVQNTFQVAWENILFCGEHLQANIFSCDIGRRAEYVAFFGRLVYSLVTVNTAYNNMLGLSADDARQQDQPFINMSFALDLLAQEAYIQPWCHLDPDLLCAFYVAPGCRQVLENGHHQLEQLLTGFDACYAHLTEAEQHQIWCYQHTQPQLQ